MGVEVLLPLKSMSPSKSAEVLDFKVSHLKFKGILGKDVHYYIELSFELKMLN